MNIKDKFKEFQLKHSATLAKVGIVLSGIEEENGKDKDKVEMIATSTLKDGTTVASPSAEFEVGAELFVVDADGNQTPAPDGDHELEDGTIVTTQGGKIVAITEIEVENEMSAEDIAKNLEEIGTKLSAALAENEALKSELEGLKATQVSQSSEIEKLKSENAKLSKQPAVSSVKQTKTEVSKPIVTADKATTIRERVLQLTQKN